MRNLQRELCYPPPKLPKVFIQTKFTELTQISQRAHSLNKECIISYFLSKSSFDKKYVLLFNTQGLLFLDIGFNFKRKCTKFKPQLKVKEDCTINRDVLIK